MSGRDSGNRVADRDDTGEGTVDHPGRKYQEIAHRYPDGDEADDLSTSVGPEPPRVGGGASASRASPALRASFWALVTVFNLALIGVSVGPMLIVFQGEWALGLQVTAVGLLLFGFGLYRYRQAKRKLDAGTLDADDRNE